MSEVTALFNEEGDQVFDSVGMLNLSVDESSQYSDHILENGSVVSDNKIRLQSRVNIQAILDSDDYANTFKLLQEAKNKPSKFTIQTRVASYANMYIESLPYEESAKIMGTISINISFVEQMLSPSKSEKLPPEKVKAPADTDTINTGSKLPADDGTVLSRIFG